MAAAKFETQETKIEAIFAQLQDDISSCEEMLLNLIKVKQNMSDNSQNINPINLDQLQEINTKLQKTNVAIIGMAGIFPEAHNLQEYWQNILEKVDCIRDVPASRWRIEDYYDPDPKAEDKTYCKRGGFLPDVNFNPMEFGLPPNILEVTDISQLLGLLVAKQAMEDAGYGINREFNREKTGVILGVALGRQLAVSLAARLQFPVWEKVLKSSGLSTEDIQKIIEKIKSGYVQWDENAFPGMLANVISGRIANRFNFGGLNCVVDAACASSLSALRMAVSELVDHRADMMLTGGVDTDNSIFAYICFSKTPAVSPGDKVKPFDADADGMMLGEGVGMLVLKRLEDAERDRDRIYAVIKGIGTSSDGKYKSIYAPRVEGQIKSLVRAYTDAGFSPNTVGLIEAHGTGTMVGDPTEFASITEVFSANNPKKQHIALGTVKSQIGHTKAAAGAASMIKTALALHHKILPPTINVTQPHPKLNIENSPFYLNTETRPWVTHPSQPRRAGVSAFGFGGTNYHVVLEEYQHEHHHSYRLHQTSQTILLSASTPQELLSRCQDIQQQLTAPNQENQQQKYYQQLLLDSQNQEIPGNYARVGFVVKNLAQAQEYLQLIIENLPKQLTAKSWEHPKGIYYRQTGIETTGKVVALFSGQGSQYLEMGRELVINFPNFRETYAHIDHLLCADGLQSLSTVVFPNPAFNQQQKQQQIATLQKTEYAQPAIGVFSAGLYKILQQAGFKPDFLAGHSFGEITALWAGGVLSEEDYLFLIKARGQAMSTPANPAFDAGGMLAVKGDISRVSDLVKDFPQVVIANKNSPQQLVLAGKKSELDKVDSLLKNQGFTTILLGVSAAFHTPLVAHAQKPFAQAIEKVTFKEATIPVYSNVTGSCYPQQPQAMQKILKEQLLNQVLFQQEIENIYGAGGYVFVEFGPKNVLTNLVKEILQNKPHIAIAVNPNARKDSDFSLREAVVKLQVAGLSLKNLDPYQVINQIPEVKQNRVLNVRLNSTNIHEKSQKAFAKALENGHQINVQPVVQQVKKVQEINQVNEVSEVNKVENADPILANLEKLIREFHQRQHEIVQIHQQSLENHAEYTKAFSQLMQQHYSLLKNSEFNQQQEEVKKLVISNSASNMMQLHEHQSDTIRIHEEYLKYQQECTQNYFQLVEEHYKLLNYSQQSPENSSQQIVNIPVLNTANLVNKGISLSDSFDKNFTDSLNFVNLVPDIPEISTFSEVPEVEKTPIQIDISTLNETLLNVVSEKTGYPVEMLELSMDIEADLGIDSIKRVEILGGLLEIYPDLPKPNPEELGELRTLEQIAEYIHNLVNNLGNNLVNVVPNNLTVNPEVEISHLAFSSEQTSEQILAEVPVSQVEIPVESSISQVEIPVESSISQVEIPVEVPVSQVEIPVESSISQVKIPENISDILLNIVSEKTGYPVEMLELSMDIEADLGIDSIKRVEILGGLLELYPDLPKPNPEEIGELRTLGEISEFIKHQAVRISQLVSRETSTNIEENHQESNDNILRSVARLKPLPEPDFLDFSFPENHIVLITDDGFTTEKLAITVKAKGWKPVVLSFPTMQSTINESIDRVILNDWSEETLKQQLNHISDHYGSVGAFIHLHPITEDNRSENVENVRFLEIEKSIVLEVFLIAKYLQLPLNKAANLTRSCFINVVRLDGQFGLGKTNNKTKNFGVIGGGLLGLSKSLNQEWESVFCRSLDLSPNLDQETSIKHILAEIHDPNLLIQEVGYSDQGRVTLVADSQTTLTKNQPLNQGLTITKDDVFLVSGGAKGITAKCVIKIAQEYQCKLILLGRSAIETVPIWAENCDQEAELKKLILADFQAKGENVTPIIIQKQYQKIVAQKEIKQTLQAIEQAGSKAKYLTVDITNGVLLGAKIREVISDFGEITGIIHGAGNLADKRIEKKTIEDFETVYTAKVKGLENLLQCVELTQLKHLILFSSVVGFYGNAGQTDYAIANEILNKTAHIIQHNYPHCHTLAINWGPWESGMVSAELKKAFQARGINTIPVEIGAKKLVKELTNFSTDTAQIVVGSLLTYIPSSFNSELKNYRITRKLTLAENPFLHDHVIANRPVLPATCGLSWMANICEQIYPGFHTFASYNFKVLKGIIFDENLVDEYTIELQELKKTDNQEIGKAIEIAAKISSKTPSSKMRFHFCSNLILQQQSPTAPHYEHLNFNHDQTFAQINQELYQKTASSLFHGTTFQGVKSVLNASEKHITIECLLPELTEQQQGQFSVQTLNPFIADVQVHGLWIWAQYFHQIGCLPSEIKTFEQFKKVPFGETFYVTCEILSKTESAITTNVITHNYQGEIYNQSICAKATILPVNIPVNIA